METDKTSGSVTILIVDDDPIIQKLVGMSISRAGYGTSVACNGVMALECITKHKPDLIISDIMMPEMDGYTLLYYLKSSPETADIPVIFLTARDSTIDVHDGLDMGACEYICKPFNPEELLACIRKKITTLIN